MGNCYSVFVVGQLTELGLVRRETTLANIEL